jgi:hypothetical protein
MARAQAVVFKFGLEPHFRARAWPAPSRHWCRRCRTLRLYHRCIVFSRLSVSLCCPTFFLVALSVESSPPALCPSPSSLFSTSVAFDMATKVLSSASERSSVVARPEVTAASHIRRAYSAPVERARDPTIDSVAIVVCDLVAGIGPEDAVPDGRRCSLFEKSVSCNLS